MVFWDYVKFYCFCWFHQKHCRCILKCGHMVNSMGSWSGAILVCTGTLHSFTSVSYFSTSRITWGFYYGVASLIEQISILTFDLLLGAPVETLLGRIWNYFLWVCLLEFLCVRLLYFNPQRCCMGDCMLFSDRLVLLCLYHPQRSCWGGWFSKSFLGISMPPCVDFLVQLVGCQVLYFSVHELHFVLHKCHHLWMAFLEC